jgi:CHAT domain-containing protein
LSILASGACLAQVRSEPAAVTSGAEGCSPMLAEHAPVFAMNFVVTGTERISRTLLLPANADILVLAREQGLDVRLEVKREPAVVALSDDPIARTGTQRAAFRTTKGAPYSLEIVGKEHSTTRGRVEVRALAFAPGVAVERCVVAERALAAADAQFAAGQLVSLGIQVGAGGDAATAYKASAKGYADVAASLSADKPSSLLAEALYAEAAALYWGVQDWEASCTAADRAIHAYGAVGSDYEAAKAQALLAAALMETGPHTKVTCGADPRLSSEPRSERIRRLLSSAAAFHARRNEPYDEALALNNLGLAFSMEDDYAKAMPAFQRAQKLYERSGEKIKQAQVLQNIGWANYALGRLSDALVLYSRALSLMQPQQDPIQYASMLNNSAVASTFAGDHDTALRQLSQALDLSRAAQDKWWEVTILDNIGLVYDRIGEKDLALDFYRQSLALGSSALISSGRRNTLAKMANILREQGDYAGALSARKEAQALAASPFTRSIVSIQLAADYRAAGNFDEATKVLDTVLGKGQSAPTQYALGLALLERAHLESAIRTDAAAESDYRAAMQIFRTLDSPEREFDASLGLARSLYRRAAADDALRDLQHALQLAEDLRQQSANPELRARLLETSRPAFDLKISILADRYGASQESRRNELAVEALQTAEQARARALADFTRLDMSAAGLSPRLLEQRQTIYSELSSRRQRLQSLLETSAPANPLIAAIRTDIATLRQRLNDIDAQLAATSIRSTSADVPLRIDLQAMPADAAIVEYWLGEDRALAWVLTREGIVLADLGRTLAITDAALAMHRSMRELGSVSVQERLRQAQRLHEVAFAPIESLVADKRSLTFVADGALHYVPFGVLQSRGTGTARFVIQDHDLSVAPSTRALLQGSAREQPKSAQRMLLVADPVYAKDDARLAGAATAKLASAQPATSILDLFRGASDPLALRRLPGTAAEASAIRALFAPGDVDTLEGTAATRAHFLATDFRDYRFIHIASHAVADSEIPQLSALILSTVDSHGRAIDGRVLAADLLNLRLNPELLVLSGCETALGKSVAGEGLIGLQYIMLARGARSVMSSLWEVPDRETAELMSGFYSELLQDTQSPRRALSNAMRSMLARNVDPGIWSAFVLTTSELNGTTGEFINGPH